MVCRCSLSVRVADVFIGTFVLSTIINFQMNPENEIIGRKIKNAGKLIIKL